MRIVLVLIMIAILSVPAKAHPAWGIAVDKHGQVFFTDLENIWKIDANGRQTMFRRSPGGRHTHEISLNEADELLGEDLKYDPATKRYTSAIWRIDPAGNFSYIMAPTQEPPLGLSIWKDRQGNTYLAQTKSNADPQVFLIKRAPGGPVETLIGDPRMVAAHRQEVSYGLGGMAFGTDGSLFLTDRVHIRKVEPHGEITTIARNIGLGKGTALMGLAVDANGVVYAADYGNKRVLKIDPNGKVSTALLSADGWSPSGVAARNGDLYVLEFGDSPSVFRVRKMSASGQVTVLSTPAKTAATTERPAGDQPANRTSAFTRYILLGFGVSVILGLFVWRIS